IFPHLSVSIPLFLSPLSLSLSLSTSRTSPPGTRPPAGKRKNKRFLNLSSTLSLYPPLSLSPLSLSPLSLSQLHARLLQELARALGREKINVFFFSPLLSVSIPLFLSPLFLSPLSLSLNFTHVSSR